MAGASLRGGSWHTFESAVPVVNASHDAIVVHVGCGGAVGAKLLDDALVARIVVLKGGVDGIAAVHCEQLRTTGYGWTK